MFTGCFWQPPLPSHLPLVPQVAAAWTAHIARGSGLPLATGMQRPGDDASAQLRQAPVQAFSQQTLSTQKPETHSPPASQTCPFCFGPHVRLTQAMPSSQSASVSQVFVHSPATQRNGWQVWMPPA